MQETLLNKALTAKKLMERLKIFEEGKRMKIGEFKAYFSNQLGVFYLRVSNEDFTIIVTGNGNFEFSANTEFEKIPSLKTFISGMMKTFIKDLKNRVREEAGNTLFDPTEV